MLFTRFTALALPIIGAIAAPAVSFKDAAVQKRGDVLSIVTDLQTKISDSVTQIRALDGSNVASGNDLTVYLSDIGNNLNLANVAVGSVVRKRDIGDHPKVNAVVSDVDINEVAQVLASIIADVTNAINELSDDLKGLPAVGALIGSINNGLSTILLGVEVVLAGVIQLVDGLLSGLGLGGLLAGLGLGDLLGGILG